MTQKKSFTFNTYVCNENVGIYIENTIQPAN